MMLGKMMNAPLTITSVMAFAEKVHGAVEIVSIAADNSNHRYTYKDAFHRARQLANALKREGVRPSDRVGTLAWNDHRHFELYYAVSCSGAVCHTVNPRLFPEQIEFIVNHADDRIMFADPTFVPLLEKLQDKFPGIQKYVILTDAANMPSTSLPGAQDYESFIANESDEFEWPELDENSACALCYTSGTTSDPKGVLYNHRSLILHSYALAMRDVMSVSANDVILAIVPMFHVNAWGIPYCAAMVGSKLVLPGPKMGDGEVLQRLIDDEGVTVALGVPTIWLALLGYLRESGKSVETLERVIVGGAACPYSIMEEFEEKYGVYTHHAWGMTELSPLGTLNPLRSDMAALPKEKRIETRLKQGRPVYGVDMRIVDEDDQIQPWDGEAAGEIRVRGNWVCSGYYGIDDTSESHDKDGFFRTGDVATIDEDSNMKITDRTKDVIKSGGEWISSIELENTAIGHPDIAEAAVIGIPHPKWTERPLLIATPADGAKPNAAEILAFLKGKVASWWIPDDVVFVDAIPHTATGKVSKKELRKQFTDYRAR